MGVSGFYLFACLCLEGVGGGAGILFCSKPATPVMCCRGVTLCISLFVPEPPHPYLTQTDMKLLKVGGGQENEGGGGGSIVPRLPGPLSSAGAWLGRLWIFAFVPAVRSLHREGARKDHECQPMGN